MTVRAITDAIEAFAPLSIQESWDNSGLIVGSPDQEVNGVLVGFDCTPELVDEAVACGADMIVTHHPLIFGGIKKISPDDPTGLALIKAISAGVAVYAAHTTADKVLEGVSGAMARRLGLKSHCFRQRQVRPDCRQVLTSSGWKHISRGHVWGLRLVPYLQGNGSRSAGLPLRRHLIPSFLYP